MTNPTWQDTPTGAEWELVQRRGDDHSGSIGLATVTHEGAYHVAWGDDITCSFMDPHLLRFSSHPPDIAACVPPKMVTPEDIRMVMAPMRHPEATREFYAKQDAIFLYNAYETLARAVSERGPEWADAVRGGVE